MSHEISAPDGSYKKDPGTFASKIQLIASKITGVIMIVPSIAWMTSEKHFLMISKIFFILMISWKRKIFKGTESPFSPGSPLGPTSFPTTDLISGSSKFGGTLASKSLALSCTYSSLDLPPPDEASLGLVFIKVRIISEDSFILKVKSAFAWSPKTSGRSIGGKEST